MKYLSRSKFVDYPRFGWEPTADIYSSGDNWLVKVELAGVNINDIDIHIDGSNLILQGIRRDKQITQQQTSHAMEIAYNPFKRVFAFSNGLEQSVIDINYEDGMLCIALLSKA